MRSLLNPKGKAVALHLHPEYAAGRRARKDGLPASANPHPFFGSDEEYNSHYAWDIGWQEGKNAGTISPARLGSDVFPQGEE